jgi:hypothetical protein
METMQNLFNHKHPIDNSIGFRLANYACMNPHKETNKVWPSQKTIMLYFDGSRYLHGQKAK